METPNGGGGGDEQVVVDFREGNDLFEVLAVLHCFILISIDL